MTWPSLLPRWLEIVVAVVLGVAGVALIVASKRELHRFSQRAEPGFATRRLVTTGIFARTRNPIYLASVLFYPAAALGFQEAYFALATPIAVVALHVWLIRPEERYLKERFGEAYRRYCVTVSRWWTFVRSEAIN